MDCDAARERALRRRASEKTQERRKSSIFRIVNCPPMIFSNSKRALHGSRLKASHPPAAARYDAISIRRPSPVQA
jgi:hypothetical protein